MSKRMVDRLLPSAVACALALCALSAAAPARGTRAPAARESRWAYLAWPVRARARPDTSARVLTIVRATTADGMPNLVLVLGTRRLADGSDWARVRLAILPNDSTGWVRRTALGSFHENDEHLVVDRGRLAAVLYRSGKRIFTAPIGVGQPRWPTPAGNFYVREKLTGFDDPFYGPIAFGTSARSAVLTDWPGGGVIGIHGTNTPGILPGRVSHGCIRMTNPNISRLSALLTLGTPVTIR